MRFYWELFFVFCKIGAFTLGGGYAMLPLIEKEIVTRKKWIDHKEFLDIVAMSQAAPGILAVNVAVFVGYKLRRLGSAVCSCLGAILPSFIIILLVAMFFQDFRQNTWVERIFKGIRPAVVALIAVPVFRLGRSAGISLKNGWFVVLCALCVWWWKISPVYIILTAALGGYLVYRKKKL